jgi:hypothetical protein
VLLSSKDRDEEQGETEEKEETHFDSKELDPSDQNGIILGIQLLCVFPDKCTKVVIVYCFLILSLAPLSYSLVPHLLPICEVL